LPILRGIARRTRNASSGAGLARAMSVASARPGAVAIEFAASERPLAHSRSRRSTPPDAQGRAQKKILQSPIRSVFAKQLEAVTDLT
jgi:hypothetical protein